MNETHEIDTTAAILGGEIEIQLVGSQEGGYRLFLTEEAGLEMQVQMSISTAWQLLDWLYDRREALYRLVRWEAEEQI